MAEAEALAVTISALLLMPEAVEALKQMILVAWAGESVMDLRCLLDGRKVPLVKSADKWVVSLSQLPLLLTDGGSVRGNDSGEGVGYSDYIRMFLFLKSVPEITMRTLDCVEEALHSKHILFQADQCVTKLEIQNKIIVYKNLNYQYPVYLDMNEARITPGADALSDLLLYTPKRTLRILQSLLQETHTL